MVDEWENKVKNGGGHVEVEVGDCITHLAINIIAFTSFGSGYKKGKKVFEQVAFINLMGQKDKQ